MLEDSSAVSLEEFHLHRESYLPMVIIDRTAALERGGVGGKSCMRLKTRVEMAEGNHYQL